MQMDKHHRASNHSLAANDMFRLPPDLYSKQSYSDNFIKLFRKALTKVYSPKKQSQTIQSNPKYSLATIVPAEKTTLQQASLKKSSTSAEKQSFPSYLTERQKLINQILSGKTQIMTAKNQQLISKRCKTLENPDSTSDSQLTPHDSKTPKIPFKLRQAFNSYRSRNLHDEQKLPPIAQKLSPTYKKTIFENLEIINKYKLLEAQYKSNQFISSPMQIFSVSSPSAKDTKKSKTNSGISKLTKESIIRSKSRKLKYALDGISRNQKFATLIPENKQKSKSYRLDELIEEDEILQQMWKEKQKTIESIKDKIDQQNHNMMKKNKKKKKLIQRQPLDEYFRPWENSSQAKRYSQFSCHEIFPITGATNNESPSEMNQ